jgi:hypothetical protein
MTRWLSLKMTIDSIFLRLKPSQHPHSDRIRDKSWRWIDHECSLAAFSIREFQSEFVSIHGRLMRSLSNPCLMSILQQCIGHPFSVCPRRRQIANEAADSIC